MKDKIKNIIITLGFVIILVIILLANILKKDQEISIIERRKLAQFPEITLKKIVNEDTTKKIEEYAIDQFIARDTLRKVKSFFNINILRQQDNNKLFEKNGAIYKMEYPLKEENVSRSIDKIKGIYEKHLQGMNVYYAVIPDKNYYLKEDEHLKIDYNKLKQIISSKLKDIKYIDIWDDLELEDYYKTDLHWKQENLQKVVKKIQTEMKLEDIQELKYTKTNVGEFYGTYYGQLGKKLNPDKMYILTNDIIESCKTYNYEKKEIGTVYDRNNHKDKYDIYLSGATPLIDIENQNANTEKELLLFRDSFGSSIAPLLIQNYKKITLIDLRYMSSTLIDQYIEFKDQDVLFLYSALVLNQYILQ